MNPANLFAVHLVVIVACFTAFIVFGTVAIYLRDQITRRDPLPLGFENQSDSNTLATASLGEREIFAAPLHRRPHLCLPGRTRPATSYWHAKPWLSVDFE